MAARRYIRGPMRRDQLKAEGKIRQEQYDKLSVYEKIKRQLEGGHDGRQLQKLYGKLERERSR